MPLRYPPIEEHGLIGDLHSVALVATDGTIDWCCLPHFDSPSLFASLLDADRGGYFRLAPTIDAKRKQMYLPDTNILMTRFLCEDGVGEIVDFMPARDASAGEGTRHQIYRIVRVARGRLTFQADCVPAFDYARTPHRIELRPHGALFASDERSLALHAPVPLAIHGDGVRAVFSLNAGESATFVLEYLPDGAAVEFGEPTASGEHAFRRTVAFWQSWLGRIRYEGRWREMVHRSALTLKLLTFAPTGAIVAAPTMSLPEQLGGVRNWDYRFTWIRDASFTLYAFLRLGLTSEAAAFMEWIRHRCEESPDGSLQLMYTIHGRPVPDEIDLHHLAGYCGARPVRVGNSANAQYQLDIYGELMDAVYLHDKHGTPISYDFWTAVSRLLDYVAAHWHEEDEGIWEVRSGRRHFVYSKLMCWVALNRGSRLANKRGLPGNFAVWVEAQNAIFLEIMRRGWNAERQCFVQHYGSTALDAANLIMPLVKFIAPTDPRMLSTLAQTADSLVSDSLVHRYQLSGHGSEDGVAGREGTFSMCTFWYVEALARAGRTAEARLIFDKMLGYANHLGLFAEQIGLTGDALGNFPQAFTHLGLISAAVNLDRALNQRH
jgi:GH15 family glucan-1,4-alpha-glucosidase